MSIICKLSNLFKFDDDFFKNKINLGLDLQGGSYLLLEIDNQPIVSQTLQNKLIDLKNPMSDYLNLIFTNLNKNKMLRKNNDIVINSTKIMERLIDY